MAEGTALVVIDVQMDFVHRQDQGRPWANPGAGEGIAALLAGFRAAGLPVVHVHHHDTNPDWSFHPSQPGSAVQPCAAPLPGEPVHVKTDSSAFSGTLLAEQLRADGIGHLVIAGGAANYCVESTARMAPALGFRTTVVADALINFGQRSPSGRFFSATDVLDMTLANLGDEFAEISTLAEVLHRIGGTAEQTRA